MADKDSQEGSNVPGGEQQVVSTKMQAKDDHHQAESDDSVSSTDSSVKRERESSPSDGGSVHSDFLACDYRFAIKYKCTAEECKEIFDRPDYMHKHLRKYHKVNGVPCPLKGCDESFPTLNDLVDHQYADHKGVTAWACKNCPKVVDWVPGLNQHQHLAHSLKTYKCCVSGCSHYAANRVIAIAHYKTVHLLHYRRRKADKANWRFRCRQAGCGKKKVFHDRANFRTHKLFHAST